MDTIASNDARMRAWADGMRRAKASGSFANPSRAEQTCNYVIGLWRDDYVAGRIDLATFEARVERELANYYAAPIR